MGIVTAKTFREDLTFCKMLSRKAFWEIKRVEALLRDSRARDIQWNQSSYIKFIYTKYSPRKVLSVIL